MWFRNTMAIWGAGGGEMALYHFESYQLYFKSVKCMHGPLYS